MLAFRLMLVLSIAITVLPWIVAVKVLMNLALLLMLKIAWQIIIHPISMEPGAATTMLRAMLRHQGLIAGQIKPFLIAILQMTITD